MSTNTVLENIKGMEAQRLPCPPVSLEEAPVQLSCLQAIPAASDLLLSPMILQPEQTLAQTVYVKALNIPFYQPVQSNHKLSRVQTNIILDNSNVPFIQNQLLHSEGTNQLQAIIQKQPGTINIVSSFSVLPQNSPCVPLGSPRKSKNAGKYLCKHCGRDCLKPSVLEKHMRSHTGERPFPCSVCGIAFKTQSNLYKHRRTQTHVNNARVPSESESSSLLEETEKVNEKAESSQTIKSNSNSPSTMIKHSASEYSIGTSDKHLATPLSEELPVSESQGMKTDNSCHGEKIKQNFEKDSIRDSTDFSQRKNITDQRSPKVTKHSQLQRQQAMYSEKLWNKSLDTKIKKCESTDSGYQSHSDSVEHQMLSPGFLHSLCECSTESEGDADVTTQYTADRFSKVESSEKATGAIILEKKKLEEHISRLISHNEAVVDDTQLDSVRPRKTVLSKQGSIDLPMPYTYKDSFHFDIRPLNLNKKKNQSLCSAKSIFAPVEKSKPLFFHSVPTQFSTTIDVVPVTRSNSLPFIKSTKKIQDQVDSSKLSSFTGESPDVGLSSLLHSNNFATSMTSFLNNHPRALVRQVAVDDGPQNNVIESFSLEDTKCINKSETGVEVVNSKCKKPSQRKLKMFSQEKWQVYGNETFKKIYQKMKSNQPTKKQKDTASTTALLCAGQLKTEVTEKGTGNLFAVQKLTKKSFPIRTGVSSNHRDLETAPVSAQHMVCDLAPHLIKNDFLPKYILKYSQEGNNIGMPLIFAGEPENISYISLPSTSTIPPYPACNNSLFDSSSADVSLCPLQLHLSHPARKKEQKWDMHTNCTSLVASPPAFLETTVTAMVDRKYHLQNAAKKMKNTFEGSSRDSLNDQMLTEEEEHETAYTSQTPERKVCFTTMYSGGIFISSDITGQSSSLQLIQSGNTSVISVSSLVGRALLCEGSEEEIKKWHSDVNCLPGFQDVPTYSVGSPKCLCHSSSMLYCHVLCNQAKEGCTLPRLSVQSHAGKLKVPSLNLSFPTLNAEPQLTWCCLSRSLPLPIEQKEIKDSAYSSLFTSRNVDCGLSICKMESCGKAANKDWKIGTPQIPMSSAQRQQVEKEYFLKTGVEKISKTVTKLEREKGKCCKRRKNRSQKRIKMKINQKGYEGYYGCRHCFLKTKKSSKNYWASRTSRKYSHINTSCFCEHCRKCHCFLTTSQGHDKNRQEPSYSTIDKTAFSLEEDKIKQDTPGSNVRSSNSLFLQRISTVQEYSCPLSNNTSANSPSNLDVCSLGTFPKEQHQDINLDCFQPSTELCNLGFIDTNKSHTCNFMGSHITRPVFVSSKACCNETSKYKNVITSEPSAHITERNEQVINRDLYPFLKKQFAPTCQTVLLKSRLLSQTSVPNKSLPDIPSESNKKQSLDVMNKKSNLDYDEISSSDDEDRLVIEV